MTQTQKRPPVGGLRSGMSDATEQYIVHVNQGVGVRAIARQAGVAASTVSRRVARIEERRGDPLFDEALDRLGTADACNRAEAIVQDEDADSEVRKEARRVLRRLCETGAVLALAQGLDTAAVLREGPGGQQTRTAVVARKVALAFAVHDWIEIARKGKITTYRITEAGRAALKRMIAEDRRRRGAEPDLAEEAQSPFAAQHRQMGLRAVTGADGKVQELPVNLAESPLASLARRKGADGKAFLSLALVQAGEKLREDFERAQMGPRVAQNWDRFLTAGIDAGGRSDGGIGEGPAGARARVADAVEALGPGLSDVVLRVCCFLEGLEATEKRLGWSARSGKIVLKIALERLLHHYQTRYGYRPALKD